jgi:hydrogenase expression/formation protein HypC
MCLSVPGKVLDISSEEGFRMGRVDFGGIVKKVCLEYLPDIQVGDYALVHVGFAISRVLPEEAEKTLKLFRELDGMEEREER